MFHGDVRLSRARLHRARTRVATRHAAVTALGTIAVTFTLGTPQASADEWTTIARWRMNDRSHSTMADATGEHPGTTVAIKKRVPGHSGRAYWFDGTKSYALVQPDDDLNPGDRDIRISLWLKTTDTPARPDWDLVKKGYAEESPGHYKMEWQPSGRPSCGFRGTFAAKEVTGGRNIADGKWHEVVCTKTAHGISLAVDGKTVAQKTVKIGSLANTDKLVIGAYRGPTTSGHFRGRLDEAVIEMTDRPAGR
jgi:hypothetical protein